MDKDKDAHAVADRYGRGKAGGGAAYTSDKSFKTGDDIHKDTVKNVDRSKTPNAAPYGSGHYPAKGK
jgi:hypothetical protein